MFANCNNLGELYISSWDVSNFRSMDGMFMNCNNLKVLDLSKWNICNVSSTSEMFRNCNSLTTIYTSEKWGDNSQVTSSNNMFLGCKNLEGAITYDAKKTDITYANYNTGYFTYKN